MARMGEAGWVEGGCHCGGVRFAVRIRPPLTVVRCNCSICRMTAYLHLIVPAEDFRLLRGEELLSCYRFHSGTARHLFCSRCGIKSFYVPRSNPDGWSVNVRCLDEPLRQPVLLDDFDGRNWEAGADRLARLSRPR